MPIRNSAFDRYVKFVPNRILKAQELELAEQLQTAMDQYGIGSVYRDGGTLNVQVTITGDNISLGPKDGALPMFVFLAGRFETLSPAAFSFAGIPAPKIYLNYSLLKVTYDDAGTINDATLIDSGTGEKVAELGQLSFALEDADKSIDAGFALNAATEFAKNSHAILVYEFTRNIGGALVLSDTYERVKTAALGAIDNAGMVRVTAAPAGLALSPFDPYYLEMDVRLKALEAVHPHRDWSVVIAQILDRLDAIVIPPPYVPPAEVPFLRIEPDNLDFTGMPYVAGTSAHKSFTLVNYGEGDGTYNLENLAAAYGFSVLGASTGVIKMHSAITFTVVFTPDQPYPTPVGGAIKINNDLVCTVTGSTRDALADEPAFVFNTTSLDFSNVFNGEFKLLQLTITNVGGASGQYHLELPNGAWGPFIVSDDGLSPMSRTLAPGGTADIQVVFKPGAVQMFSASISFQTYGKNSCALRGTGLAKPLGVRFQFTPANVQYAAVKQGVTSVQTVTIQNVGDAAGTPDLYLTNTTDFVLALWMPTVLQPGQSAPISVVATGYALGDKTAVLAVRSFGNNQCQLAASVTAAAAPKFVFSETTRTFSAIDITAGPQTRTVNVTNNGTAAGIPDVKLSQTQTWFQIAYTPVSLGIGASLTVTITFTPTADMAGNAYPAIGGALSFGSHGDNSCAISSTVVGPAFRFTQVLVDGGIVEFNGTGATQWTLQNVGTGAGTVNLTTDPLFAITGSPAITLAAGGSASVQLTFVANAAAFLAKYPNAAPVTLYEFTGRIYGAQNIPVSTFRARSNETRLSKFSSRPQGGAVNFPVQVPDIQVGAARSNSAIFYVYNIGNFSGKPSFTQVSGNLTYFSIARYGVDSDIPPGGFGTYSVTASGNEAVDVTKTARFGVDDGSFQFSVHFVGVPFQTMFCDSEGNRLDTYDAGRTKFSESGATKTFAVYLKRLNNTLGEAVVTPSVNAGAGTYHPIEISARTEGSLVAVNKIPVYVTLTMNGDGQLIGHLSATGSINTLEVTASSFYLEPEAITPPENPTGGLFIVYTPYGIGWTNDSGMWGKFVPDPEFSDNGLVNGGTPTYPMGFGGY